MTREPLLPRLSRHAEEEMARINREWLEVLLDSPEQRLAQPGGKEILQSRFRAGDGRMYLLRAVVAVRRPTPLT